MAARRSRHRTIPSSTTASRWCAREAFPLSGDEGHRRDPRHDRDGNRCPRRPARQARCRTMDVLERLRRARACRSSIPAIIKPFNVVLDAGSGMAGLVAPKLFERLPCKTTRLCFDDRRHVSQSRSQPADRGKPPRHRRAGDRDEGRHRHRLGWRRGSLLLHRRRRRVHRRRLRHGAARRGVPAEASGRDGRLRPARQLCRQGHRRASTAARRS